MIRLSERIMTTLVQAGWVGNYSATQHGWIMHKHSDTITCNDDGTALIRIAGIGGRKDTIYLRDHGTVHEALKALMGEDWE